MLACTIRGRGGRQRGIGVKVGVKLGACVGGGGSGAD